LHTLTAIRASSSGAVCGSMNSAIFSPSLPYTTMVLLLAPVPSAMSHATT
jgi:hypothetical protein